MPLTYLDPSLSVMLFLKKNWAETNPAKASIQWTTAPVAEPARYPQIQVNNREKAPNMGPIGERHTQLNIGTAPVYWIQHKVYVDIYIKPDYSSNSSIGDSKDQRWNCLEEIERIFTYNPTGSTNIDNVRVDGHVSYDIMIPRPEILHSRVFLTCFMFRTGST